MRCKTRRMKFVCTLATGCMLFQLGGCSFNSFLRYAHAGFAQSIGGYAAGLLLGFLQPDDGPGPICIGPGCDPGNGGPS